MWGENLSFGLNPPVSLCEPAPLSGGPLNYFPRQRTSVQIAIPVP